MMMVDLEDMDSTPTMCLIINQEYQHQLEELIMTIEDKLEENSEKQRYLLSLIKSGKKQTVIKDNSYLNFITPYFRDSRGLHPPPNEDTIQKSLNGELNQNYAIAVKKWTPSDEQQLFTNVQEFYVKDQLKELRAKKNDLLISLKVYEEDKFESERLKSEIEECERQINRSLDASPISNDLHDKVDWLYVSRLMDNMYDNLNCKLYWVNYLHPLVNKDPWSAEEIDKLGNLTKDQKYINWERIAEQLMTNRKAWQVAKQYQITFNSNIKHHGPFTKEEIDHLASVIERCQIDDYIPWNQVYYFIDGRSLFQLKAFWSRHIANNDKKKNYWTLLEDTVLLVAFDKFKGNWRKIAFYLPGRTNRQVRDRYVNRLGIRRRRVGNWSMQEDRELIETVEKHGTDFKEIAKTFKHRSEHQIRSRHKVLIRSKEVGEQTSYKVREGFQLQTIRYRYLWEKARRAKVVDSFLVNARDSLLEGIDYEQAKKNDLEELKIYLEEQRITKLEEEEMNVDCEIANMFEHYNLIPNKFQPRPELITSDNVCLNEVLTDYLNCLMKGHDSNEDYLLNNVIKYLFKTEITDFSESDQACIQHPPILPPNRTTMLAFFGVLMKKDQMERSLLDDESQESMQNFNLGDLKNDPEYRRLKQIFFSLFLWPAILTDTQLPVLKNNHLDKVPKKHLQSNQNEDNENDLSLDNVNEISRSKKIKQPKQNKTQLRQARQANAQNATKVRCLQSDLIQSYLNHRKKQRTDK